MTEKQQYRLSRIVIVLLSFLTFQVLFINEDISFKITGLAFSGITWLVTLVCSRISKKIIRTGDGLNGFKKILFYMGIPIIFLSVIALYLIAGLFIIDPIIDSMSGWDGLGVALLFYGSVIIIGILTIVPPVQTYIILIVRKICKKG